MAGRHGRAARASSPGGGGGGGGGGEGEESGGPALGLQHQCEAAGDQGCRRLSARFAGVAEVPRNFTDAGRLRAAVDEVSGLAHADGFEKIVAVGDSGRVFVITMPDVHDFRVLDARDLEVPPGDDFVDAESVSVICADAEVPSCALDDPETSILVGSERNDNSQARIAEYFVNGTIKNLDFVSPALLAAVGLESASQEINGGFEAMTTSADHRKVIFTTEDPMPVDAQLSDRIRRFVVWDRDENSCQIFRYETQHESSDAGVVDITYLDKDAQFVSVIERKYEAEWKVDKVYLFYVQLKPEWAIKLSIGADGAGSITPAALTEALHALAPLPPRFNKPVFSFPEGTEALSDNFEGAVLLPPNRLVLASDNNESPAQHTYLSTLELVNEVDAVLSWASWGGLAGVAALVLVFCMCCGPRRRLSKCCGVWLGRQTAYVDLGDDETMNTTNVEVELAPKRDELAVL